MYYVYVIQNVANKKETYIGYTSDLRQRLQQHNSASNRGYTRHKKWRLVYYEGYLAEADARRRERRLKQDGRARYQLLARLLESLGID